MDNYRVIMGENPAEVIARSCTDPDSITHEDFVILSEYYTSEIEQIQPLRVIELVADFGVDWEEIARVKFFTLLSTQHGRRWYEVNIRIDPDMARIGDRAYAAAPQRLDYYREFNIEEPSDEPHGEQ